MQAHVDSERLAGISVLINRRGRNAYYGAAGTLDVERRGEVRSDSIFRVYSMTKPVTSVAAMMLYEEGAFQLDDPVARFLPEFTDMQVVVGGDADAPVLEPARSLITLRHLLTHTAGFTYDFGQVSPVDALYRRHGINFSAAEGSLAEMVGRLAELPLQFHPGTQWNYGVSTDVLGRVVEVISGQSLDEFFQQRIFSPLGMHDTAFHVDEAKLDRFAAMYTSSRMNPPPRLVEEITELLPEPVGGLKLNDPAPGGRFSRPAAILSGGGGLTSTTEDYLRFALMLRNSGMLDGERLLGKKTVEYMRCNHLAGSMADMGQPRFNNAHMGSGVGFGLGFAVVLDPARAQTMGSVGEYFWTGMANTQFWIDPVEDLIVIQMAQLIPSTLVPVRRELRALVAQALEE
ncbi:MAG: beta-lactamase family protein [Ectothiorhodospiraceae bacterium]|nr:beta-lactamase family protein [Ectothiorhodospiraceae bacterium]